MAKNIYVLFHANCADGFGAALACHLYFRAQAKYIPVQYGQMPPQMEHGATVYIVDFSYPRQQLIDLAKNMQQVTVLDHHRTAKEDLDNLSFPNLHIIFDMEKSGAVLAWEHFFPNESVPELILDIQDRDLWLWQRKNSLFVGKGLRLLGFDFQDWEMRLHDTSELITSGHVVDAYEKKIIAHSIRCASLLDIDGHIVPTLNTPNIISETGNALCSEFPHSSFSAVYYHDGDGYTQFSLRSIGDFDVSKVAKRFGGGGHKNAAGFRVKNSNFPKGVHPEMVK